MILSLEESLATEVTMLVLYDYIWIFVKSFLSQLYAILIMNILDP